MEIEDLTRIVEHVMPEDPERLLDELIQKAVAKTLEWLYKEGPKWIRRKQKKKRKRLKGGG